jgi:hypothetical protein
MRNPFNMVRILFMLISPSSALKAAITGDVYKLKRLPGSTKEDVVINALPISGDQFQLGTANVNIYVPNVAVSSGTTTSMMPDTVRLDTLAMIATGLLEQVHTQSYRFYVGSITTIEEPESNSHYVNLRIDFQFFPSV